MKDSGQIKKAIDGENGHGLRRREIESLQNEPRWNGEMNPREVGYGTRGSRVLELEQIEWAHGGGRQVQKNRDIGA